MTDRHTELERQISHLTTEVARLRRLVIIGFAALGVLLVAGVIDRDLPMMIAAIGIVIWALAHLSLSLGGALRSYYRRKGHDVA